MGRRPGDSFWSYDSYHLDRLPKTSQEIIVKRLRLLEANRYERTFFTLPMARYSGLGTNEVLLSEFVAWGLTMGWDDMPQELAAMAQERATSKSDAPPATEASQVSHPQTATPQDEPSQGMSVTSKQWEALVREDDAARQDPTYKAKYDRAAILHDELEKWERMEHKNDPVKAIEIEKRLSEIRDELTELNNVAEVPDEAALRRQAETMEADLLASFKEHVYNGKIINWRYWVHQLPELHVTEAARLMCGLDPEVFESLDNRPNKNDPTDLVAEARRLQRLAERQNLFTAPPAKWLEWAGLHGFDVHGGFRIEVEKTQQNGAGEAKPPVLAMKEEAQRNVWDEAANRQLLKDLGQPGATHADVAKKYGTSRSFIGKQKKKAEEMLLPKKAGFASPLGWNPKK